MGKHSRANNAKCKRKLDMTVSNTETKEPKSKRQHCESRVDLTLQRAVGKRPKIQSKVIIPEKSDKSPIKRSQRVKGKAK